VTFWAATIDVAGKEVGSACGIVNTGGNIGGLIAPITSPMIAASLGWSSALYFGSGVAAIGLVTWLYVDATRTIDYLPQSSARAVASPY
jgi:nitrate/nitrite transporter NarK